MFVDANYYFTELVTLENICGSETGYVRGYVSGIRAGNEVISGISVTFAEYDTDKKVGVKSGVLSVDHCREGSLDIICGDRTYRLSAGDICVSMCLEKRYEISPQSGKYSGAALLIDPEKAPRNLSSVIEDINVSTSELTERFSEPLILRRSNTAERIFTELYSIPEGIRTAFTKIKVIELLLYLSCIDTKPENTAGCTRSQIRLAEQVSQYICENTGSRMTIAELSELFGVSPTQLKNSFRAVYGSSVYSFVRKQKMLSAAKLLKETDRSILDIAGECGYDNGSKFSKAFSSVIGTTPSRYRRENFFTGEMSDNYLNHSKGTADNTLAADAAKKE